MIRTTIRSHSIQSGRNGGHAKAPLLRSTAHGMLPCQSNQKYARLRLRRLKFVREQFFLAAAAQNIERLVRFLSQGQRPMLAATT